MEAKTTLVRDNESGLPAFAGWWEAFDYCREKDMPVVVLVAGERWKLYPSGHTRWLRMRGGSERKGWD